MGNEQINAAAPINIGGITLPNRVFLAPMAGITDTVFRRICRRHGAGLVVSEMVSAKGFAYNNKNTTAMLEVGANEHPAALQLFGSDPAVLAEMARRLSDTDYVTFDINMGCPAPKIVRNGDGSALMKDPSLVARIVDAVVKASKKPVTVKIRAGFDNEHKNAVVIARIIADNGGAAVAVHGRTRSQFYSGKADWDIIAGVVSSVSIPVIGNGDVVDALTCEEMFRYTGCAAVMIGRGAMGNPWVFDSCVEYAKTGVIPPKTPFDERIEQALAHTRAQIDYIGAKRGIPEMRAHLHHYLKGFRGASEARTRINTALDYETIEEILLGLLSDY